MFEGNHSWVQETVTTSGTDIHVLRGGSGPPVLLLHGAPQTHAMWHAVAPALAETHTVVATDLRGYGDSGKPAGGGDHAAYSFRAMAADQVEVMRALGHERYAVVGHDRGGRVAHRLVRDHPEVVTRWAVLDIVPTDHVYAHVDRLVATAYFHWFFLPLPEPVPERMIGPSARETLRLFLSGFGGGDGSVPGFFTPEALAEYERCFDDPAMIHALCEDYRAASGIDLEHDAVDRDRLVEQPLLVLWGSRGLVEVAYDALAVWGGYAADVRGQAVDAGHFLAEERPAEVLAALLEFLV